MNYVMTAQCYGGPLDGTPVSIEGRSEGDVDEFQSHNASWVHYYLLSGGKWLYSGWQYDEVTHEA